MVSILNALDEPAPHIWSGCPANLKRSDLRNPAGTRPQRNGIQTMLMILAFFDHADPDGYVPVNHGRPFPRSPCCHAVQAAPCRSSGNPNFSLEPASGKSPTSFPHRNQPKKRQANTSVFIVLYASALQERSLPSESWETPSSSSEDRFGLAISQTQLTPALKLD
jgi:hypothetical protein